ncbi:MAG TPA: prepilin-type N-terminal cleavage/methylation domain-containing protein [Chloroflexota bacterium]|nr:prepilin-type N-terminal cleavage/methylation domain-containing protein [Chloroflexota bacterium]
MEHRMPNGKPQLQSGHSQSLQQSELSAPVGAGHARPAPRSLRNSILGFTFVELMVVITIMVIIISMAIPIYQRSIIRAKESVLHNNLNTLRTTIDNYTYDKQKAPQSLQDLVSEGYLRQIPIDPMTGTNEWQTVMEEASQAVNQSEPGIFDVKSTSDKIGLDGTPYNTW